MPLGIIKLSKWSLSNTRTIRQTTLGQPAQLPKTEMLLMENVTLSTLVCGSDDCQASR